VDEFPSAFEDLSAEEFRHKYGFDRPQPHTEIVLYCRTGRRAEQAALYLLGIGYKYAPSLLASDIRIINRTQECI
jgi:rhodanese-related sulfurtransferase